MNRSEFIKWLAATPFAPLLIRNSEGHPEPANEEAEKVVQTLHGAFHNREPVELFGMEFYIEGYEINNEEIPIGDGRYIAGRQNFRLTLVR